MRGGKKTLEYDNLLLIFRDYKTSKRTKGVHDGITKSLEQILNKRAFGYDFIRPNVEYKKGCEVLGECDLWTRYTTRDGTIHDLFFEIKCSDNGKKDAYKQLRKNEKYLGKNHVCYRFIVTKKGIEWLKREQYAEEGLNYYKNEPIIIGP